MATPLSSPYEMGVGNAPVQVKSMKAFVETELLATWNPLISGSSPAIFKSLETYFWDLGFLESIFLFE